MVPFGCGQRSILRPGAYGTGDQKTGRMFSLGITSADTRDYHARSPEQNIRAYCFGKLDNRHRTFLCYATGYLCTVV